MHNHTYIVVLVEVGVGGEIQKTDVRKLNNSVILDSLMEDGRNCGTGETKEERERESERRIFIPQFYD